MAGGQKAASGQQAAEGRKRREESLAKRKVTSEDREKSLDGGRVDIVQARAQAKLIANAARQKLMLEVIDDLERCRDRRRALHNRIVKLKAREDKVKANEARLVTDDEGRVWAVSRDLPDRTTFVDGAGVTWKYDEAERHLNRIIDGPTT